MLFRIIAGVIAVMMAAGFLWFMSQVIWLGFKEFFRRRVENADHRKQRGRTAPNHASKK